MKIKFRCILNIGALLIFMNFYSINVIEAQENDTISDSFVDKTIKNEGSTSKSFLSGYAATTFSKEEDGNSTFSGFFSPLFHYKVSDKIHFIGELELELEEGGTNVSLEIAELDYFLNNYLTLSVGQMPLPFNSFTERSHTAWINKLPTMPPIYGGHDGGGLVPGMFDLGIQLKGGAPIPLAKGSKINYAIYLVNGPTNEMSSAHDEDVSLTEVVDLVEEEASHSDDIEFTIGNNFNDNNSNKAIGGRIGFLPYWNTEIGFSAYTGKIDDEGKFNLTLIGLDFEHHFGGLIFKAEYIHKEVESDNDWGHYEELSYRLPSNSSENLLKYISNIELVARFG